MKILSVQQICVAIQQRIVIQNFSFELNNQQRLFLLGEIGAGKSTLLHSLLGFIPIQSGKIKWFDKLCVSEADFQPLRGGTIGICFQNAEEQLFGPTVLDDVAFGPLNQGLSRSIAYERAEKQLMDLDISHLKNRAINATSGGEKTFIALAGVLAMQPKVLLLDEPTNGLDRNNKEKLIHLLQSLKLPMIIASHDQDFVKRLADTVVFLEKSEI